MSIQSWSKTGIDFDLYLEQNRIRFLFKFNLILIKYLTKFELKTDSKLEQSFNYLNLDQIQIRFLFRCGSSFDYILEKIWIKGWSKTGADFALNLDQTRIIFFFNLDCNLIRFLTKFGLTIDPKLEHILNQICTKFESDFCLNLN